MSDLGTLLGIEGVLALGVMSPGPNFAVVSSAAMQSSRRAGVLTAFGVALGTLAWAALAMAGLGLLLRRIGWLSVAVGVGGALYLIWLGGRILLGARRGSGGAGGDADAAPMAVVGPDGTAGLRAVGRGFASNMTNPKALAFYGGIFAVTVPAAAPAWLYAAVLLLAGATSALWYGTVALLFSHPRLRTGLVRARARIDAVMGAVLVVLGLRLLARSMA